MNAIARMKYEGFPMPNRRNPTSPTKDLALEQAIAEYESSSQKKFSDILFGGDLRYAETSMTTLLTCNQINMFLSRVWTPNYHDSPAFCYLGYALSALMKKAYDNGHNSFHIILPDQANLPYFGVFLRGSKEKPYTIDIVGNLGEYNFYNSSHINATIHGNAESPGSTGEYLNLDFHGEVTGPVGYESKNSVFRFSKAPSPQIGFIDKATNSIFQVYDDAAFKTLQNLYLPYGSKIELLAENGEVREKRI